MSASIGRITAHLAEQPQTITARLVDLINRNINPPAPLKMDEVYIRAMYVVSDETNSFGGCFPSSEHQRLAELMVDSPVMVGHRKDRLPIARSFYASLVERDGRHWVKSYFYWPKGADGADDLRRNIDGGIYKECSVGFTFLLPECSICGEDIRTCRHQPLEAYDIDGEKTVCHFNYRRIERVLETSLVYRGATPDTSVTRDLATPAGDSIPDRPNAPPEPATLANIKHLNNDKRYLVIPAYEGRLVTVSRRGDRTVLTDLDGSELPEHADAGFDLQHLEDGATAAAQLVAYRGKERLGLSDLDRFLAHRTGPTTRLELKLYPQPDLINLSDSDCPRNVRVIPHQMVDARDVETTARELMTRDGVRLWAEDEPPPNSPGYLYRPTGRLEHKGTYCLTTRAEDKADSIHLSLKTSGRRHTFAIRQCNLTRLKHGVKFVADVITDNDHESPESSNVAQRGRILDCLEVRGGMVLTLVGVLSGEFALQPIRLAGKRRHLFYRRTTGN